MSAWRCRCFWELRVGYRSKELRPISDLRRIILFVVQIFLFFPENEARTLTIAISLFLLDISSDELLKKRIIEWALTQRVMFRSCCVGFRHTGIVFESTPFLLFNLPSLDNMPNSSSTRRGARAGLLLLASHDYPKLPLASTPKSASCRSHQAYVSHRDRPMDHDNIRLGRTGRRRTPMPSVSKPCGSGSGSTAPQTIFPLTRPICGSIVSQDSLVLGIR